jgi:hypothetical protein
LRRRRIESRSTIGKYGDDTDQHDERPHHPVAHACAPDTYS